MRLKDEFVVFHLSAEGREALGAFFPHTDSVGGYVLDVDDLGVWIWVSPQRVAIQKAKGDADAAQELVPVILLKRQYFSTAEFDMDPNSSQGSRRVDLEVG